MVLGEVSNGSRCRVTCVLGSDSLRGKLARLGIIPGTRLSILNHCFGSIIIECKGSMFGISKPVFENIQVD